MHFSILSGLKKTTTVVECLSTTSTRCSVTENSSLQQDGFHSLLLFRFTAGTSFSVFSLYTSSMMVPILCTCIPPIHLFTPFHVHLLSNFQFLLLFLVKVMCDDHFVKWGSCIPYFVQVLKYFILFSLFLNAMSSCLSLSSAVFPTLIALSIRSWLELILYMFLIGPTTFLHPTSFLSFGSFFFTLGVQI